MREIAFCENNFAFGTEEVMNRLKQNYKDISVKVESCLGQCGDCAQGPYAMVDGDLVQEDTAEGLYEKITTLIDTVR